MPITNSTWCSNILIDTVTMFLEQLVTVEEIWLHKRRFHKQNKSLCHGSTQIFHSQKNSGQQGKSCGHKFVR